MKVYIGSKEVRCEMPITYTAVLDETFDNASIVIPFSYRRKPYAPRSIVKIETDSGERLSFRLVNDTVALVSRGNKNVYQHTITLVEHTSILSTRILKNICCYQPATDYQKKVNAISCKYVVGVGYYIPSQTLRFSFSYFKYVPRFTLRLQLYQIQAQEIAGGVGYKKVDIAGSVYLKINGTYHTLRTNTYINIDPTTTSLELVITEHSTISFNSGQTIDEAEVVVMFSVEREFYNYNFTDIVDKIRTTAMQIVNSNANKDEPFLALDENSSLYKLLNVRAPNFTFTQCTIFDALQQIFLYFDGIPRLSENKELTIEYFNQFKIENDKEKIIDERLSLSADTYINGIMGDISNVILEKPIIYPSASGFFHPRPIRAGKYNDKELALVLPRPINKIKHLWVLCPRVYGINQVSSSSGRYPIDYLIVDILPILKTNEELALLPDTAGHNELSKNNTICYSRGSNIIGVATTTNSYGFIEENIFNGLQIAIAQEYGVSSENITVDTTQIEYLSFRIEYEPMISTRIKSESLENKYDGEIYTNQSSIEPSISKIARNMFGLSLKYGNEEIVRSKQISTFDNRYKIGDNYDIDDERYIVNSATTTFFNGYITSQATLTKDFNKLSSYLSVDEKKRFTNIDRSIAVDSREVISDYLVYDSASWLLPSYLTYYKCLKQNAIYSLLDSVVSTGEKGYKCDLALFRPLRKSIVNETIYYTYITNTYVSMPLVCYGLQNSFVFDFAFDDPMSAGVIKGDVVNNMNTTQAIPYTSENGTFDAYDLKIINVIDNTFYLDNQYPKMSDTLISNITKNEFFFAENVIDKKDANEITKLTYQLHLVPNRNEVANEYVFGRKFFEDNAIFRREAKASKMVILDDYVSQFDDKVDSRKIREIYKLDNINNRVVSVINSNNTITIQFELLVNDSFFDVPSFNWEVWYEDEGQIVFDYNRRAFVLIDDDNNILIAKNNYGYDGENFYISFSYTTKR